MLTLIQLLPFILGGISVLIFVMIVLSIVHVRNLKSRLDYGEALKKDCSGSDPMIIESGEYQVFSAATSYENMRPIIQLHMTCVFVISIILVILAGFEVFTLRDVTAVEFWVILILMLLVLAFASYWLSVYVDFLKNSALQYIPKNDNPPFYSHLAPGSDMKDDSLQRWQNSVLFAFALALCLALYVNDDGTLGKSYIGIAVIMIVLYVFEWTYITYMPKILNELARYSLNAYQLNAELQKTYASSNRVNTEYFRNAAYRIFGTPLFSESELNNQLFRYLSKVEFDKTLSASAHPVVTADQVVKMNGDAHYRYLKLVENDMPDVITKAHKTTQMFLYIVLSLYAFVIFHLLYTSNKEMTLIGLVGTVIAALFGVACYKIYTRIIQQSS